MRNFLRACEDYDELSRARPLGPITVPYRDERDGGAYWDLVLHCSLLRKFVASDDDVSMRAVVQAVRTWLEPEITDKIDGHLAALAELLETPFDLGSFDYVLGNRAPIASGRLVHHLLYGWHLHGDADKRDPFEGVPRDTAMLAMSDWSAQVARRLSVTRQTVELARDRSPF